MDGIVTTNFLDSIIQSLVEFLKFKNIELSNNDRDGRINSITNEDELIKLIIPDYINIKLFKEHKLIICHPGPRHWYDILIKNEDESIFIPINIKVSDFNNNSADNISSKAGIFYSLTGIKDEKCPTQWKPFFKLLSENINEHSSDYYFIIINKNDYKEIYFNSLRRIDTLIANGNNPPFQCNWSKNKIMTERSFEKSKFYILESLYQTAKLRAEILLNIEEYFSEMKSIIKK